MAGFVQNLRYAMRQLKKTPTFTVVAVLTLALRIGANTAIFTTVNALLLKMLPVRDPQELVIVGDPKAASVSRYNGNPKTEVFSYPLYKELRDRNLGFTGLCAAASDHDIEVDAGQSETPDLKVTGRMVSGNYFTLLGLEPAEGRLFSDSDDTAEGANPVVVLGYRYWQRKFALSPAIIGNRIRLNGYPFTVVGVAPAGFDGDVVGEQAALFVPLSMQPQIVRGRHWRNSATSSWLSLIGRLKPDLTPVQAEANLNIVLQQSVNGDYGALLSSDDKFVIRGLHINVSPGGGGLSELRGNYKTPLLLLMGMVGLVLLIACVNVANLLLARASIRRREIAVRIAIGANRRHILKQLFTESVLLALFGGGAGSLFAIWGVRLLVRIIGFDTSLPLSPDGRVFTFTIAISLLTGILFGFVPALRTVRVGISPVLKDTNQGTSEACTRFGWGKGLIAGQVALSLLVLFAAVLLLRSLEKLLTQNFGYNREHLVIARLDPTGGGYTSQRMKLLSEELVARLRSTAGVRAVTYSTNGLFAHTESGDAILVPGFKATNPRDRVAREDYVGPDYFKVVGIPILAGRGIEAQDTETSTRVAVVNEAMVKYFFAGQNPIGRQFRIDDRDWLDKPITIVGISRNAKDHGSGIREEIKPRFYEPFQQVPDPFQIVLEVQASGTPSAAVNTVIAQIKATDSNVPILFVSTLDDLVNDSASSHIALAKLASFFAALALLLASIGLYGVMSYSVTRRTREIGVRMALGAEPSDVVQLVLGEGVMVVALGLAIGLPLALASSRVVDSFLFGLTSTDPLSLIAIVLILGVVAAVASLIPARRASLVDPMAALRYE